ncbi:MAG: hypothetical protein ACLQU3_15175 [Limisphaerales bacterium]
MFKNYNMNRHPSIEQIHSISDLVIASTPKVIDRLHRVATGSEKKGSFPEFFLAMR